MIEVKREKMSRKKIDLHVHSDFSEDSIDSVLDLVEQARDRGLNGFAITDHGSLQGAQQAVKLLKEINHPDMILIKGAEINTKSGHILALGIERIIERNQTVNRTVSQIHEQDGVAIAPHPYKISGIGEEKVRQANLDGIEVYNSLTFPWTNKKAKKLAEDLGLAQTGGSDSHRSSIGHSHTLFPHEVNSEEDVLENIRENNTETEGETNYKERIIHDLKNLWLRIKRGGRKID